MVAFEDAEGFAEEVGLVEAVWGFGFYAVVCQLFISIYGVEMGKVKEGLRMEIRSGAFGENGIAHVDD